MLPVKCPKERCKGTLQQNDDRLECNGCGLAIGRFEVSKLRQLVKFYEINGRGDDGREASALYLGTNLYHHGLVFRTSRGWFPSTKGIEIVKNYQL